MFHAVISLSVWLTAYVLMFGWPHVTALLLPLVFLPLTLLIMGFSWMLASLGVYLRDVSQFVVILTTVLMFLSPIFYPISALPQAGGGGKRGRGAEHTVSVRSPSRWSAKTTN